MIEITDKDIFRFESFIYKTKYCWLWEGSRNEQGYGIFGYRKELIKAHRFAFMLYKNIDPGDFLVCHICDIPPCINPDHLFLGTYKINNIDCIDKGKRSHIDLLGENNFNSTLTREKVLKIRYMSTLGYTRVELGKVFGVTHMTICHIVNRKTWTHI